MDESLPPVDKAIIAFFEIVAFALGWNGVERFLDAEKRGGSIPILLACIVISYIGFKWPHIKQKAGPRFASFAERITGSGLGRSIIYSVVAITVLAIVINGAYKHYHKPLNTLSHQEQAAQPASPPTATSLDTSQSKAVEAKSVESVKGPAQKEKNTQKREPSKTSPTGPVMKMLADVMAGKPVPPSSSPSKAKTSHPAGPPPSGTYRCPDGRLVPEHHAEQCGATNITTRYNTFDAGSPPNPPTPVPGKEECGIRNSTTSNNIYRNGALPDLSGQCDSQFNNNLTENKAPGKDRPKLTIGGKQNDIGHNTFPKMDVETTDTSQGNKLHDNSFQDSATREQAPTTKNGNGADATAILKAQTRNQYPGGFPDEPWPIANAVLYGTPSSVADQLAAFIDGAHKIVAAFMKDDNAQSIAESEKAWEAEAKAIINTNLGKRFAQEFDEAESISAIYPPGHNAKGGSICNLIDAKVAVLSTFVNQLRAATH